MKLFYDLIPIIIFFVAYKIAGIYVATAAAIIASFIQVFAYRIMSGKFEKMQVITLILMTVLGGATILFHDPMFIKWKVSVINWLFALVFLGSAFIGHKNLVQRLLDSQIKLPSYVWRRLNYSWVLFFLFEGTANIIIVYHFDTNVWVNFKMFGTLILTFLFVIGQAIYLSRHLKK